MDKYRSSYLPECFFEKNLLSQQKAYKSYEYFGAHIIKNVVFEGVSFVLFAPNALSVSVVGDFNRWNGKDHVMKKIDDKGIWHIVISDLKQGDIYKYEIHTKDNKKILKADPYAFFSQKRPETASVIASLDGYKWNDEEWMKKRNKADLNKKPMMIYELHLGSWKRKENGQFYNYREIADELIEYVLKMGYTHVEILPICEHPLDDSWGYQVTGYYSVTSRYGQVQDFMYFVDKCHQNGIGVILDWVPGHFCKDEHGLYRFDGSALYEYDNEFMSENIEWGTAIFDYRKSYIHSFLISNAIFWLDKYHIDGLRVDAVSYMLYLNAGKSGNKLVNMYGGDENLEAIEFIKKLNEVISMYFPQAIMIAEESTAWPSVTKPTHIGGLGFDFKWNMGWMNDILKYMEIDPIHRKWHHNLITFSFMYAFSEKYILPLSHDEVVHGKKSLIQKMPGDYWNKFANLRLLYSYMIAHPGKKLIFMGSEFAHFSEWNFNKELDWMLLDFEKHSKTKKYVEDLIRFYKSENALYELESDYRGFEWIDHQNYQESVISFMRKGSDQKNFVIGVFNFTPVPRYSYKVGVPVKGRYKEVFNSDLSMYGGSGCVNDDTIESRNSRWNTQPYHITLNVPPLGAVFLKLEDK
ncbi:1,4-alpha-glucan branching enzyme [Alkalithermobacter thermoalcaliphilus JW-YL-7 = DSM 7308]|uniref:1,4-alpha-glucan branching enzyme GlgB n=1 Tax=Alkalithermobacter thermoalcaliphilus JW-YL-7 = DSM 7308 TaxID=1121328 RepID=A0A150FQ52_CLOPD|nr:1,4-alpha-glucan-branching enzyme [[Clostridium] paradoxum JW-YL-7 = DSM 7308]SHK62290.1 1,4-alpha-glucan branching enzyme [[Clostridium] paradoxum JW-YL-7 = DSM 7308]